MSKQALLEAQQLVDEELDELEQETLQLWQQHVDSIKLKGGKGSGHFGHSGRPGKVGGSGPGSVGAYVTIYHGTPSDNIDGILREGIKRGGEWFGRPPSVYYLTNKDEAEQLVKQFVYTERFAIFEARVPKSVMEGAEADKPGNRDFDVTTAARIEVDINPGWLSAFDVYERYDVQGNLVRYGQRVDHIQHRVLKELEEGYQTIYIIVAFDEGEIVEKEISIDPEIVTEDHESLLKDDAIELRTASMSSSQMEKLIDKYNQLLADEDDAKRLQGIRERGTVPPPILGGTEEDWWVVDGMHRIATLAHDGVTNFPAYFLTGIRNIKQLPIDEASKQVLLDVRIELLKDELDSLAEKMYSGDISIGQFQEDFKSLIRGGRTSAAAIGKGGWDQMGPRDWGRLGTPLREEYKFLQGFIETIENNKDTISLKYIKNRARMYADNIVSAAVQAEAGFYLADNLPYLPRDGSTECLSRCHCAWLLDVVESRKSYDVVEATWVLGEADHCNTCVSRNGHKEVIKVPKDVNIPAKIGGY